MSEKAKPTYKISGRSVLISGLLVTACIVPACMITTIVQPEMTFRGINLDLPPIGGIPISLPGLTQENTKPLETKPTAPTEKPKDGCVKADRFGTSRTGITTLLYTENDPDGKTILDQSRTGGEIIFLTDKQGFNLRACKKDQRSPVEKGLYR